MNKDFLENEVKIGDYVAFARNPYASMILGKVIGYTEYGFKVIRKRNNGEWNSYPFSRYGKDYETILPYQCVKIDYKGE